MKIIQSKITYKEKGIEIFGKELLKSHIEFLRICLIICAILFFFLTQYSIIFLLFSVASILLAIECGITIKHLITRQTNDNEKTSEIIENHKIAGSQYYVENYISFLENDPEYKLDKKELIKKYPDGFTIREYKKGNFSVTLEEDPDNTHDSNAVKVLLNGNIIGYIKKGSCSHIKNLIQRKQIAKVDAVITHGNIKEYSLNDNGNLTYHETSGGSFIQITIHKVKCFI